MPAPFNEAAARHGRLLLLIPSTSYKASDFLAAAERYQTHDLGIVTNCYHFEHRKRSFELVAECLGVAPSSHS